MLGTIAGAIATAWLSLSSSAAIQNNYYVDFYIDSTQVGHGVVHCADQPFEYILIWGSDSGEMVVYGQENCDLSFPF